MSAPRRELLLAGERVQLGERPWLMGIVNASPDSFSDAGLEQTLSARVERARELLEAGADVIDIGGESGVTNRPAVDPAEEIERVVPLIERVAESSERACPSTPTSRPWLARRLRRERASSTM